MLGGLHAVCMLPLLSYIKLGIKNKIISKQEGNTGIRHRSWLCGSTSQMLRFGGHLWVVPAGQIPTVLARFVACACLQIYLVVLTVRILLSWFRTIDWYTEPWNTLRQVRTVLQLYLGVVMDASEQALWHAAGSAGHAQQRMSSTHVLQLYLVVLIDASENFLWRAAGCTDRG